MHSWDAGKAWLFQPCLACSTGILHVAGLDSFCSSPSGLEHSTHQNMSISKDNPLSIAWKMDIQSQNRVLQRSILQDCDEQSLLELSVELLIPSKILFAPRSFVGLQKKT